MQTTSTYKRTEKITRFTISTPLISHNNSADQHEVFVTLGNGRTITVPKNGSYRLHPSGVLEHLGLVGVFDLEPFTLCVISGGCLKVYLKHFQDAAQNATVENISLS